MPCRMPFLTLSLSQQPHARMNYLRPMGNLWRAKAAIMLIFLLKFLLIEMSNASKAYHEITLTFEMISKKECKKLLV